MDNILSVKDAMKLGMRGYNESINYNWHGKILVIKYMLSLSELGETFHKIIDMCIRDGEFAPELLDFSIKLNIIAAYAYIEIPAETSDAYKLVYYSDLYDVIIKSVCPKQIEHILNYFGRDGRSV